MALDPLRSGSFLQSGIRVDLKADRSQFLRSTLLIEKPLGPPESAGLAIPAGRPAI